MNKKIIIILFAIFLIPSISLADSSRDEIIKVFRKYIELNTEFVNSVRSDSPTHKYYDEYRPIADTYAENTFNPILEDAKKIFCEKQDVQILTEYFKVLINTTNSADEYPSFVLGDMFICDPELFRSQYEKLKIEEKSIIYGTLEWGFCNVTWKNEDKIPDYNKLKSILNSLKSKTRKSITTAWTTDR